MCWDCFLGLGSCSDALVVQMQRGAWWHSSELQSRLCSRSWLQFNHYTTKLLTDSFLPPFSQEVSCFFNTCMAAKSPVTSYMSFIFWKTLKIFYLCSTFVFVPLLLMTKKYRKVILTPYRNKTSWILQVFVSPCVKASLLIPKGNQCGVFLTYLLTCNITCNTLAAQAGDFSGTKNPLQVLGQILQELSKVLTLVHQVRSVHWTAPLKFKLKTKVGTGFNSPVKLESPEFHCILGIRKLPCPESGQRLIQYFQLLLTVSF